LTPLSAYELFDLHQAMMERMEEGLLPAISTANRTGELSDLLRLLGMSDLMGDGDAITIQPTRVVVLGDSMVKERKLRSIVRNYGLDPGLFEFALEYNELKHYNFGKLRDSYTYKAVLVGPMPHSTPGKHEASSAIAEMEAHPDIYPQVIRIETGGSLKITANSFEQAIKSVLQL